MKNNMRAIFILRLTVPVNKPYQGSEIKTGPGLKKNI